MSEKNALGLICQTYSALLQISLGDPWRAMNQSVYARLRSYIAEATGMGDEWVQSAFENTTPTRGRPVEFISDVQRQVWDHAEQVTKSGY